MTVGTVVFIFTMVSVAILVVAGFLVERRKK